MKGKIHQQNGLLSSPFESCSITYHLRYRMEKCVGGNTSESNALHSRPFLASSSYWNVHSMHAFQAWNGRFSFPVLVSHHFPSISIRTYIEVCANRAKVNNQFAKQWPILTVAKCRAFYWRNETEEKYPNIQTVHEKNTRININSNLWTKCLSLQT